MPSGNLQFVGSVGYSFDAPNVTITIEKLRNNDDTQSGSICVQLWNYDSSYKLIASFSLSALEGNYSYTNIRRTVEMRQDVSLPYLELTVSQKYKVKGFVESDSRKFSKTVSYIQKNPYVPPPRKTTRNFRITTRRESSGFLKKGVKAAAKVAQAVGTVGGIFFPPLRAVGVIGSVVDGVTSFLFD